MFYQYLLWCAIICNATVSKFSGTSLAEGNGLNHFAGQLKLRCFLYLFSIAAPFHYLTNKRKYLYELYRHQEGATSKKLTSVRDMLDETWQWRRVTPEETAVHVVFSQVYNSTISTQTAVSHCRLLPRFFSCDNCPRMINFQAEKLRAPSLWEPTSAGVPYYV